MLTVYSSALKVGKYLACAEHSFLIYPLFAILLTNSMFTFFHLQFAVNMGAIGRWVSSPRPKDLRGTRVHHKLQRTHVCLPGDPQDRRSSQ